jgi:hypothetical protein
MRRSRTGPSRRGNSNFSVCSAAQQGSEDLALQRAFPLPHHLGGLRNAVQRAVHPVDWRRGGLSPWYAMPPRSCPSNPRSCPPRCEAARKLVTRSKTWGIEVIGTSHEEVSPPSWLSCWWTTQTKCPGNLLLTLTLEIAIATAALIDGEQFFLTVGEQMFSRKRPRHEEAGQLVRVSAVAPRRLQAASQAAFKRISGGTPLKS